MLFKKKKGCYISINFFIDNKKYFLIVEDNGIGYKKEIYDDNELSGLNLVKMLCEEIKAEINIVNENGMKIIINFPINLKEI